MSVIFVFCLIQSQKRLHLVDPILPHCAVASSPDSDCSWAPLFIGWEALWNTKTYRLTSCSTVAPCWCYFPASLFLPPLNSFQLRFVFPWHIQPYIWLRLHLMKHKASDRHFDLCVVFVNSNNDIYFFFFCRRILVSKEKSTLFITRNFIIAQPTTVSSQINVRV